MQKNNIKILHIMHSEIGGAGDIALNLHSFEKKFFKTEYLLTGPKIFYGFKKKIRSLNKKIYYEKIEKGLHFFRIFRVIKKINIINPDIIILHNYQVIPSLYFKLFKKKKIIFIDHMSIKLKRWKDYFSILLSGFFFDKLVFLNKENYKKFNYINNKKKKIIENSANDFLLKKKIFKKKKYFIIGISGRINNLKNHQIVLELLNKYPYFQKKIKIYIAGSGENKINLLKIINKYNLKNNIKFCGALDEQKLKEWFGQIDLYLHPSFGEAMSSSILQAMSSNTPILASNVNGINNLIGKKKYLGVLFENEINDLKNKINYFINLNKNEFKKFQKVQRDYFLKKYNIKTFCMKYQKLIDEIV